MFTFSNYLLAEAAGMEPQEQQAAQQDQLVNLVSEVKKVMRSLDLSEPADAVKDPRSFTFIDLIEALSTLEDVVKSRLNSEGGTLNDGSQVAANGKEWQGDEKKGFESLFRSIGEEAKDAIRTVFTIPQGDGTTSTLPRFVNSFNSLIVDRVIDGLRSMGIDEAREAIGGIVATAKHAVISQQQTRGKESSAENRQLLNQYRRARQQTIGQKDPSTRTKKDRLRLIGAIAHGMHQDAQ